MKMTPFLFIAPAVLLLAVFSFFPIIVAFGVSFTDMNLRGLADWSQISFVGVDNFIALFSDTRFLQSMFNTFFLCFNRCTFSGW